jgi:3',5'-cyclic AMP phosphodiesterase CpdA
VAAGRPVPRVSFIVVSDTHVGREDRPEAARVWERTAVEIDSAMGAFVLHLGDLVDGRREAQYPVYLEGRKRIKKPVYEIPGNHDTAELFAKYVRKTVDLAFDHQGIRFLMINNSRPDSVDGFVTAEQIDWLDKQCADAGGKGLFVMMAMHVPAHPNEPPDAGAYVKEGNGQAELEALLKRHERRVLALLHGHFHCGLRGWEDRGRVQEVIFPSALFNKDYRLGEGKAAGYWLDEYRPGYVLVSVGPEGMRLRYKAVGVAVTKERVCRLGVG